MRTKKTKTCQLLFPSSFLFRLIWRYAFHSLFLLVHSSLHDCVRRRHASKPVRYRSKLSKSSNNKNLNYRYLNVGCLTDSLIVCPSIKCDTHDMSHSACTMSQCDTMTQKNAKNVTIQICQLRMEIYVTYFDTLTRM
jgi:hypothetical protein